MSPTEGTRGHDLEVANGHAHVQAASLLQSINVTLPVVRDRIAEIQKSTRTPDGARCIIGLG
jgi:hypothetical protein